jgi:hypothetical protein
LALNKPVSVSSFDGVVYRGENAVDGDLITAWNTLKSVGNDRLPTEWIIVNLEDVYIIDQVVMEWGSNYSTNYNIQVSLDNINWNTIINVTAGDGQNDTLSFTPVQAQYIMLETTTWNNSTWRNWLNEFVVYGSQDNIATATPVFTATPTSGPTPTNTATLTPTSKSGNHIGDLDGFSLSNQGVWRAQVWIVVHDLYEAPLANAAVTIAWSGGGYSGTATCTTDFNGTCIAVSGDVPKSVGSLTITVIDISNDVGTYSPNDNHDSDGDSDGTVLIVYK